MFTNPDDLRRSSALTPRPVQQAPVAPQVPAGWYPDPQSPPGVNRWWDGTAWTEHRQVPSPPAAPPLPAPAAVTPALAPQVNVTTVVQQAPPQVVILGRTRRPRGALWWICIGWWWVFLCWCGRVTLWVVVWPLGLWRSRAAGRRRDERALGREVKKYRQR